MFARLKTMMNNLKVKLLRSTGWQKLRAWTAATVAFIRQIIQPIKSSEFRENFVAGLGVIKSTVTRWYFQFITSRFWKATVQWVRGRKQDFLVWVKTLKIYQFIFEFIQNVTAFFRQLPQRIFQSRYCVFFKNKYQQSREKIILERNRFRQSAFYKGCQKYFKRFLEWAQPLLALIWSKIEPFLLKTLPEKSRQYYQAFLDFSRGIIQDIIDSPVWGEVARFIIVVVPKRIKIWYEAFKQSAFWKRILSILQKTKVLATRILKRLIETSAVQKIIQIYQKIRSKLNAQIGRIKSSPLVTSLHTNYQQKILPHWQKIQQSRAGQKVASIWELIPKDWVAFGIILLTMVSFIIFSFGAKVSGNRYLVEFHCCPDSVQIIRLSSEKIIEGRQDTLEFGKTYTFRFTAPGYEPVMTEVKLPELRQNDLSLYKINYWVNLPQKSVQPVNETVSLPNHGFLKVDVPDTNYYIQVDGARIQPNCCQPLIAGSHFLKVHKPGANLIPKSGYFTNSVNDTFNIYIRLNSPEEPLVKYARVRIETIPTKSQVTIKKKDRFLSRGESPLTTMFELNTRHEIHAVSALGFMSENPKITLTSEKDTTLVIRHRILPRELTIQTEPADAVVYINNERQIDGTPLTTKLRRPGRHHIKITKRGYQEINETIEVQPGNTQPITIKRKLQGLPIHFSIRLDKKGKVYIDNRLMNGDWQRTIPIRGVTVGRHDIYIVYRDNSRPKLYKNFMIKPIVDWSYDL